MINKKIATKLTVMIAFMLSSLLGNSQGVLNMSNGYIVENGGVSTTPIYLVVGNPSSGAIIPGSGGIISEEEWNMVRWYTSYATGIFVMPFSYNPTTYLPVTLNITTNLNSGLIDFSTWHTNADNGDNTTMVSTYPDFTPSDVTNMGPAYAPSSSPTTSDNSYNVADRFWVVGATYDGNVPTLSNMTFSYISSSGSPSEVSSPNVFTESTLMAQRFNSTLNTWGDWAGTGGTDNVLGNIGTVSTGMVTVPNFFRSWTLSSSNSPLPIQISSFTDQCDNGVALIQWTSQSELNNNYYTVKKTADNIHFEIVGTMPGAGTTTSQSNYSMIDHSPYGGTSYYILEQTDFDNITTPVGSISFTGCGSQSVTTINGYNTANYIQVQINSVSDDNYQISLVNMLGQTVINENHSVSVGDNIIRLNNTVSPGIYILNVRNEKNNYSKKMVVGVK